MRNIIFDYLEQSLIELLVIQLSISHLGLYATNLAKVITKEDFVQTD